LGALVVNSGFTTFVPERVPADDPALSAGQSLAELLRAQGVTVGNVTRGPAPPAGPELAQVASPPFREIAAEFLKVSNNTTAELVTRELAVHQGRPGTTDAGTAAMAERLTAEGVPMAGVRMLDGSGLSRDSRLTCEALAVVLEDGRKPGPTQLDDLLAVADSSGTLALRFGGSPLADRLEAKTGSLNGVTALAGYVDTYRRIPFSFVGNGDFSEGEGIGLQNRVVGVIGRYPAGLDGRSLVPAPRPPCTATNCR
jgi:D-alanyl-D-alanine carboxypeptidase/D-alanyl-D-alanine-endopeptidase (penicillin-binding protein 4)